LLMKWIVLVLQQQQSLNSLKRLAAPFVQT
jgi:hypothetical protein